MATATDYSLKNFQVLGYSTDFGTCECCGKTDLKGTVSILDKDSEVIVHFGTTCAANANKYDSLEAAKKVKKEINSLIKDRQLAIQFAGSMCTKLKYSEEIRKNVVADYLKFREIPGNRLKRFNWEQYKTIA